MPHDDWVRLWFLLGSGVYTASALIAARVTYWRVLDGAVADGDDALGLVMCAVFWPIVLVAAFVEWFVTHEPHRVLSESDARPGLLDVVSEAERRAVVRDE